MTSGTSFAKKARRSSVSLYQTYSKDEEQRRTNFHYARSADFFQLITGGEWNVYSCNFWDNALTETESQMAKLNMFAKLLDLRPKQRILDVGCGWGGPLVYLCKTFDVSGVGLTASLPQKRAAEERADRFGVDVKIVHSHWKDFEIENHFDVVYSDEVLVHIADLLGFFEKMKSLLHDHGSMLHKELHLTHPDYVLQMTRGSSFINWIFGETGNYRVLADELALLMQAGFEVKSTHSIPNWQYRRTIDVWLQNMRLHRAKLTKSAGADFYSSVMKYLRIARLFVMSPAVTIDIVCSRKHTDKPVLRN
jgi:cyclopropane-fatty-acyl-phospholipid synthase